MAEYGAHITITANEKPSIFDVVAQETFLESFEPGFKHILKVIAEKNPLKYGWCLAYANEIYLVFHSMLQYHYLSTYGASFAENFYNLKRASLNSKDNLDGELLKLLPRQVAKSLVALTVVPYVKQTLDNYYEGALEERRKSLDCDRKPLEKRLRSVFLAAWPKVHFVIEVTTLSYYLRYLIRIQKVHSPLLHACGLYLSYLTAEEAELLEERTNRIAFSNIKSVKELVWWVAETMGTGLQSSLEVGAFFLQFLDWFYSNESSSSSSARNLFGDSTIIPPPPQIETNQVDKTKCPICLKDRKQETVLSVSGYVFCYSCILLHLRKDGKCPVTKYPATTKQLIKIYKD